MRQCVFATVCVCDSVSCVIAWSVFATVCVCDSVCLRQCVMCNCVECVCDSVCLRQCVMCNCAECVYDRQCVFVTVCLCLLSAYVVLHFSPFQMLGQMLILLLFDT